MHYFMKQQAKILCVDDEKDVLDAIVRSLRKDFIVETASSAFEAKKLIDEGNEYAIVLSDYRMPGDDGIELLKFVKAKCPNSVRAILSGQMDSKDIVAAINSAEIHRFILKPWDNEYLKIQLFEALQSHYKFIENSELKNLAITDSVTGLTNHRYFQDSLKSFTADFQKKQKAFVLIMIDVDHFKSYNDRYGHPEGDHLLRSIASVLTKSAPSNAVVSRYGGEEFAVLIPNCTKAIGQQVAEEIRKNVEHNPFNGPYGRKSYVTLSLGVAICEESHTQGGQQLLEAADKALYDAKHKGRNMVCLSNSESNKQSL